MRKCRNYEESLRKRLADSTYAKAYLAVALEEYEEDGNSEAFLLAVKDVGDIQGDLSKLVANIQLSDESLYDWCLHFVGAGILGEDADTRSRNERLLGEPERRSDD